MSRKRFLDLPRHRRREIVFSLKQRIRQDAEVPGSRFWTSDWEELQSGQCTWLDLSFPGTDRFTYWNARIFTFDDALEYVINDMAWQETRERMSSADLQRVDAELTRFLESCLSKVRGKVVCTGGGDQALLEEPRLDSLGGLTQLAFQNQLMQEIRTMRPPVLHEEFRVRPRYRNGIGLFAILDTPNLDPKVIEQFIDRFRAVGECNWPANQPSQFHFTSPYLS